jgi:predicted TIM-barrel fold metal-dependent hydrolase
MRETSGGRVQVSGPVPLNDVSRAVEEIAYAHEHLGTRCFWARPDQFNHRNLGDRYYDPVYELLQDLDCAFATHEYMGLNGASAGSDRFTTFTEWHTVVHAHEAQSAVLSMICHGVYERFPRLRCAYMEAGCGWLPSWLHRIDEQLELAGAAEFPELSRSAWDTFRANCWISTECEDRYVADVIRWMGDGHIVYETDFPHPDSKYPHATDTFLALPTDLITAESKTKILWDNAVDLYRFPEGTLPTVLAEGSARALA